MDPNLTLRSSNEPRLVVGIGASGGCAQAIVQLVSTLPSDTDMAFVVACHLEDSDAHTMSESLAPRTEMPVIEADGSTSLRPNGIYVVDPTTEFSIDGAAQFSSMRSARTDAVGSLDRLFGQLARSFGSRTVGILLCADDGDGIQGLVEIHDAGGLTVAQAPTGDDFHGLKPAIDQRAADVVIAVEYMLGALERFAEHLSYTEGHALLAAIVSSSDDAIVSKTLDGTILSWNVSAERIFGYTAEEAVGQSIELIIPSDLRGEERDILAKLRRGERVEHFETVRVTKGGRRLDISLTISPIRDKSGRIVAASKVARDITERKRAEAALREANDRKDEYLAMLGHELRNPLAAIQSAAEIIKQGVDDSPLASKGSAIVERQSSHMAKLLDGLLDVSRITRGKLALNKSQVELVDVLNDAITGGVRKAERRGIELRAELGDEPLRVMGDVTRLSQIFGNLIDNALKFTDEGGQICVSVHATDEAVEVAVRDTGIGFASDQAESLFDAFRQGPQDFSRSRGGLGLGLALARGLTELHGGAIWAHSDGVGSGATFTVRLPRSVTSQPTEAQHLVAVDALCIVMIEDNEDLANMLSQRLVMQGHEVELVSNGEAGIERVRDRGCDVVICDLGLPGAMSGLDVARELRNDQATRHLHLVALSGYGRPKDKEASAEAGFDVHLTKPVDFTTLEQLLGHLASRTASARSLK